MSSFQGCPYRGVSQYGYYVLLLALLYMWYYYCDAVAGSFLVIELNDFGVLTSWFILKAHTSDIAKKWMDHINSTQVYKSKNIAKADHFTIILASFLTVLYSLLISRVAF